MRTPSQLDETITPNCHGNLADDAMVELHRLLRSDAAALDEYLYQVNIRADLSEANCRSAKPESRLAAPEFRR